MEFQKISSPSLRELFVQQIEHLILSGQLKIGEKLPSERQLAEMMQISRAVVNSGLAELEENGFIVVKPRSGTFVADYRQCGNLNTLMSIMKYNGGKIRDEEIRSLFEVRLALDTIVAKSCIDHISDEEIALLHKKVEAIKNASTNSEATQAAFDFQHQFALCSGNTLIPLIFQSFKPPIFTLWQRFCELYGIEFLYERNYKLWTFIQKHDTAGAIAWIEESIHDYTDGDYQIYY